MSCKRKITKKRVTLEIFEKSFVVAKPFCLPSAIFFRNGLPKDETLYNICDLINEVYEKAFKDGQEDIRQNYRNLLDIMTTKV